MAAGAWAGLDTPLRWASIVAPKIPVGKPTVLDDNIESSFIESKNLAIRRMRQVAGRGIRKPDAHLIVVLIGVVTVSAFILIGTK